MNLSNLKYLAFFAATLVVTSFFAVDSVPRVHKIEPEVEEYSKPFQNILLKNEFDNIVWSQNRCEVSFQRDYSRRCFDGLGIAKQAYHFQLEDLTVQENVIEAQEVTLTINYEYQLETADINTTIKQSYSGLGNALALNDDAKVKEILDNANAIFANANLTSFALQESCDGIITYSAFPVLRINATHESEIDQINRQIENCSEN